MDEMTRRTYDFILKYKQENDGNSPGTEEIATGIGLRSRSGVPEYLDRLEALGKIRRGIRGQAKAIYVVGAQWLGPVEVEMLKGTSGHERDSTYDEEMGIEDWNEEDETMKRES